MKSCKRLFSSFLMTILIVGLSLGHTFIDAKAENNDFYEATGATYTVDKTSLLVGEKIIIKVAATPTNANNLTDCKLVLSDDSVLHYTPTTNTDNDGKMWFEISALKAGTCAVTPAFTVCDENGDDLDTKITGTPITFTTTNIVYDNDIITDGKSPNITITIDENLENHLDITADDKSAIIYDGFAVGLDFDISNISDTISINDKDKIKNKIIELTDDETKINDIIYLNIDAFKKVYESLTPITELKNDVTISIEIPDEWILEDNSLRAYFIVRLHDGEANIIGGIFNPETKLFSFETDKFSTYALSYIDYTEDESEPKDSTKDTKEVPKTNDSTNPVAFMLMSFAVISVMFALKNKNTIED